VKILDHPAHSPDLAPGDFHLFLHLKKHLTGRKFDEDEFTPLLRAKAAELYDIGMQNLVPMRSKCTRQMW